MPKLQLEYVTRKDWKALPPRNRCAPVQLENIRGACFHVIGNRATISEGASRMRQIQNFHQTTREAYDILYNFSGSLEGEVFTGRGFQLSSAAEGNFSLNRNQFSFLIQCATVHDISDLVRQMMINFVVDVGLVIRSLHDPTFVPAAFGHRDVKFKECPGEKVLAVLRAPSFVSEYTQLLEQRWSEHSKPTPVPSNPPPPPQPPSNPYKPDRVSQTLLSEYESARMLGITDGSRPNEPCSRQEAAVMAFRASQLKDE